MALTKVSRGLLTTSIVDNGNATAITIDSNENVGIGIGIGLPASLLDVSFTGEVTSTVRSTSTSGARQATLRLNVPSTGGDDPAGRVQFTYGTGYTVAGSIEMTHTNPAMKFLTGTTEVMRIYGSNVGVGTTDADSKLKVELNPSGTVLAGLRVGYNSTSVNYLDADTNIFRNGNGVSEHMRINSAGNVGIGTSSPSVNLEITESGSATNSLADVLRLNHITSGTAASGLGAGVVFSSERPIGGTNLTRGAIYGISGSDPNDDGALAFYTRTDTSGSGFSEKVRITSDGTLLLTTPFGGAYGYLNIKEAGSGDVRFGKKSGNDYDAIAGTWTNNNFSFYTNSAERLRIASDGSISIPNQNAINELTFTGTEFTNVLSATTSGFNFGTTGAGYLAFIQNNTERLQITATGLVYASYQYIGGFGGVSSGGVVSFNDASNARSGNAYTLLQGTATGGPGGTAYYHVFNYEYNSKNGTGNMTQLAYGYNDTKAYMRFRYSGTWSSWVALH